nr:sensor domain-containing diguanylate cyclase [Lysinibacillus timonensis]
MKILLYCLLYLVPACLFIFMAGIVYSFNRHSSRHITCSLMLFFSSLTFLAIFTSLIIYPEYFNSIVLYWLNGSATITILLSLHFWLMSANIYNRKNKFIKYLFIPGILMLITLPFNSWMLQRDNIPFEPAFIPGKGLYMLWLVDLLYITLNIILIIKEMKNGNNAAKMWFNGTVLLVVWSVFIITGSIIFQNTSLYFFYYFIPHGSIFWAIAIFLSISRFDYLSSFEKRYNILFQRSPLGILLLDENTNVLEASPEVFRYLGVKKQVLIHSSILAFLSGLDNETFRPNYQRVFKRKTKVENFEISFINQSNHRKTILVDCDFILVEGKTLMFVIWKDITDAKMKEERVRYLAYHDLLTGLSNRAAFENHISELIIKNEMFNLILLDLNKLKQINDTYGHQAGDRAIQQIATILQETSTKKHFAARLGGDEFVMLISVGETETLIEKIRQQLSMPLIVAREQQLHLSASIGISCYPVDGETMDQLYSIADRRMYMEKQKGNVGAI